MTLGPDAGASRTSPRPSFTWLSHCITAPLGRQEFGEPRPSADLRARRRGGQGGRSNFIDLSPFSPQDGLSLNVISQIARKPGPKILVEIDRPLPYPVRRVQRFFGNSRPSTTLARLARASAELPRRGFGLWDKELGPPRMSQSMRSDPRFSRGFGTSCGPPPAARSNTSAPWRR